MAGGDVGPVNLLNLRKRQLCGLFGCIINNEEIFMYINFTQSLYVPCAMYHVKLCNEFQSKQDSSLNWKKTCIVLLCRHFKRGNLIIILL